MPVKPACCSASTLFHGYCSLRSTSAARGAITSRARAEASAWIARCSRVSSQLMALTRLPAASA